MLLTNYDIENSFSSKLLSTRIYFIGVFSSIKKFFRISDLYTGLIDHITKKVTDIYIVSEGLKKIITEKEIKNPAKAYPHTVKALSKFKSLYHSLEKVDFLKQKEIKEAAELGLANFYKIESHLRQIAYSDKNVSGDKELTEFASNLSLSNLQTN